MSLADYRTNKGERIDRRVQDTCSRLKRSEMFLTLIVFATAMIGYFFLFVLLDHWLLKGGASTLFRMLMFGTGVLLALGFLVWRLIPLLRYSVNPLYAAKVLEEKRPSIKNALINWLLLRKEFENRPELKNQSAFQSRVFDGIATQSLKNLDQVPEETVVDHKPLFRWAIALIILIGVFCLYSLISPKSALHSFSRLVMPFSNISAPTRVRFLEITPGNASVYQGETATVTARIQGAGKQPVYLYYTTDDQRMVDQIVPMLVPEGGFHYECRFPPGKFGFEQGVTYSIGVGEDRSRDYRFTVQAPMTLEVRELVYTYPEYTGEASTTVLNTGDIRALEGTKVDIRAKSNFPMSRAVFIPDNDESSGKSLTLSSEKTSANLAIWLAPDFENPTQCEFQTYVLRAYDEEGKVNRTPSVYRIELFKDQPPKISWVDPPKEQLAIPLNGFTEARLSAEDADFGLRFVRIHFDAGNKKISSLDMLQSPAQGPTKHTGTVNLSVQIHPEKLGLKPGDAVEYWAEALDTCLPEANSAVTNRLSFVVAGQRPGADQKDANKERQQQKEEEQKEQERKEKEQQEQEQQNGNESQDPSEGENGNDPENGSENENDAEGKDSAESQEMNEGDKGGEEGDQQTQGSESDETTGDGGEAKEKEKTGDTPKNGDQGAEQEEKGGEKGGEKGDENGDQGEQENQGGEGDSSQNAEKQGGSNQKGDANQPGEKGAEKQPGANGGDQSEAADGSEGTEQGDGDGGARSDANGDDAAQKGFVPDPEDGSPGGENAQGNEAKGNPGGDSEGTDGASNNDAQGKNDQSAANKARKGESVDGDAQPGEVFEKALEAMKNKGMETDPDKADTSDKDPSARQHSKDVGPNSDRTSDEGTPPKGASPDHRREKKEGDKTQEAYEQKSGDGTGEEPAGKADPNRPIIDPKENPETKAAPSDASKLNEEKSGKGSEGQPGEGNMGKGSGEEAGKSDEGPNSDKPGDGSGESENDGSPSEGGQKPSESGESGQNSSGKGSPQSQNGQSGESNGESSESGEAGEPGETAGESDSSGGASPSQTQQGDGEPKDSSGEGTEPGTGGGGGPASGGPGQESSTARNTENEANLDYTKRQTNLALRYLEEELSKKEPDPELLNRLGWTKDELKDFVENWKKMAENAAEAKPGSKEDKEWKDHLRSLGTIRPGRSTKQESRSFIDPTMATGSRRAAPPVQWRSRVEAYNEGISKE